MALKKIGLLAIAIGLSIGCTKNGVNGDITDTGIQLLNYYNSDKTYSLIQGNDTLASGIGFNDTSKWANGAPGFYSLSVTDNTNHSLLTGNLNLSAGTKYSLFVMQDSSSAADSARYTLITDNASQKLPLYDSCRIRILNFARNIQYVDLRFIINSGVGYGNQSAFFKTTYIRGRAYLDNVTYPARSQYFTVPAIKYIIRFLNGSDTTKTILDSVEPPAFNPQASYTLLLLGKYDSASGNKGTDPFRYEMIAQ